MGQAELPIGKFSPSKFYLSLALISSNAIGFGRGNNSETKCLAK